MAQLGFLGLGIMGYPMARQLLKAGHEVALWSNTSAKAQELAKEGKGAACATPKQVAERADFIFYCVGDSAMARKITIGEGGLIEVQATAERTPLQRAHLDELLALAELGIAQLRTAQAQAIDGVGP